MKAGDTKTAGPDKSRSRKTLSCLPCRKRKVKCDYKYPCTQCKLRNKGNLCAYDGHNRWGYSGENASKGPELLSVDKTFDIWLTKFVESELLPATSQHEQLLAIYKELCHPQFPFLRLAEVQKSYETFKSTGKFERIIDGVNLLLVYAFACGNADDSVKKLTEFGKGQRYAKKAHDLISLINPLAINSIEDLQSFMFYVIYLYYNDSILLYNNVPQLIGVILGTFRGRPEFRKSLDTLTFFNLVENVISHGQGIPSITKCTSAFAFDDLYMKCRSTLMKYRDKMFSDTRPNNASTFIAFENEVKSAGGTFGVLFFNFVPDTPLNLYYLSVIRSLCNQLCLSLYRPYLFRPRSSSAKTDELETFGDKALGLAVSLIEIAITYRKAMDMNNRFSLQCWNDIYMSAFQASVILLLDNRYRCENGYEISDKADKYFQYAIRIPPAETQVSRGLWRSGETGWRHTVAGEFYELLVKDERIQENPKSANAILVLKGLLFDTPEIGVPKLFGPFKAPPCTAASDMGGNGLIPASFDGNFFLNSLTETSPESVSFEELCYQVLTEKVA